MEFVHLHVHSPFSFLDGASPIEKLVQRAAELGMAALAVTDHNSLSGAVSFHKAALKAGIKPIHGAEITLKDGAHLTLLCRGPNGYSSLCRLLSRAHLENPRLCPEVSSDNLMSNHEGLIALSGCRKAQIPHAILAGRYLEAKSVALKYKDIFGPDGFFIEMSEGQLPGSRFLNHRLGQLAAEIGLKTVATANVHYAVKHEFEIHDALTCIRTLTRIDDTHPERRLNAENYMKSGLEMLEDHEENPQAVANAAAIAAECEPSLLLNRGIIPDFKTPDGIGVDEYLRALVYEGANARYTRITSKVRERLEHELSIILRLGYGSYFLLVWDLVRFARSRGIRCAGRGSAADSAVAYCLGITDVDAIKRGLLFERFLSLERAQKPDIDVDFDARYRDDVTRYVYTKYGEERVATVCTYNTFRGRSSIRDVGKVLGFNNDEIDFFAKRIPYMACNSVRAAMQRFPELRRSGLSESKFEMLVRFADSINGFPRHLGTHLGGVVIGHQPLSNMVPLQMAAKGVVVCQYDKDDIEDLGLVKIDLLSLRTMGAVEGAVKNIRANAEPSFDYDAIPLDDKATYEMLNEGHTLGVFQLESPAQRALQSRLEADNFEDIVASVAIIRPGPIKGNMVEPYIARRKRLEPVRYMHPKLAPILKKTYGVILFQEQVIEIANVIAGFSPGESDRLRRVMTHARSRQEMQKLGGLFVEKAVANGVEHKTAQDIFESMAGYASYGFCEAHAASFANTAIKTAYLIKNYPAEFFAAVLDNQPMGYYPPNTICVEARRRGIEILRPCINQSEENAKVVGRSIRISLRQFKDMTDAALDTILKNRQRRTYASLRDFCTRAALPKRLIRNLIVGGAFDSFSENRRGMLWEMESRFDDWIKEKGSAQNAFCVGEALRVAEGMNEFSASEKTAHEHEVLGIYVSCHPIASVRKKLDSMGVISSESLRKIAMGQKVTVVGYPVRPHRPPTKSGKIVVFLSLEDEFGLTEVTVFEDVYQKYGHLIFRDPMPPLVIKGSVDRRGRAASVVASEIRELG